MIKVTVTGWKKGFQKVQCNYFFRSKCDLSLSGALDVVNRILDGEIVELDFRTFSFSDEQRMNEIGLEFSIEQ